MSASAWARNSRIAGSCKPRSIFQSTTRMELRGHVSHRNGAKFSAMISDAGTKSKDPCGKLGKDALLGETQVQRIIDLGPCQITCTAEAHSNPFVREFLYGDVKKHVDLPAANQIPHLQNKLVEYGVIKDGDPNVGSAELVSADFLAHLDHSVAGDDHLHCFIPPARINNHRNSGAGP